MPVDRADGTHTKLILYQSNGEPTEASQPPYRELGQPNVLEWNGSCLLFKAKTTRCNQNGRLFEPGPLAKIVLFVALVVALYATSQSWRPHTVSMNPRYVTKSC